MTLSHRLSQFAVANGVGSDTAARASSKLLRKVRRNEPFNMNEISLANEFVNSVAIAPSLELSQLLRHSERSLALAASQKNSEQDVGQFGGKIGASHLEGKIGQGCLDGKGGMSSMGGKVDQSPFGGDAGASVMGKWGQSHLGGKAGMSSMGGKVEQSLFGGEAATSMMDKCRPSHLGGKAGMSSMGGKVNQSLFGGEAGTSMIDKCRPSYLGGKAGGSFGTAPVVASSTAARSSSESSQVDQASAEILAGKMRGRFIADKSSARSIERQSRRLLSDAGPASRRPAVVRQLANSIAAAPDF